MKPDQMIDAVVNGESVSSVLDEAQADAINEVTKLQHKLGAVDPKLAKNAAKAIDHLQATNKELAAIRQNVTVKDISKRCGEIIMDINNAMDSIREVVGEER